jgi:hypothetical protein
LCAASARAPGDAPRGRLPAAPPHCRLLPPLTAPLPLFCSGVCACKQRRQCACNQTSRVTRAPYNPRAASAVAAKRVTLRGTAPLPRGARPSTFSAPAVHFPDGAAYTAGDDATRIASSAAAALWALLVAAPARPAPAAPAAAELVRSHAGGAGFPGPPSPPVRATPAPSLTARLNANSPSPWNAAVCVYRPAGPPLRSAFARGAPRGAAGRRGLACAGEHKVWQAGGAGGRVRRGTARKATISSSILTRSASALISTWRDTAQSAAGAAAGPSGAGGISTFFSRFSCAIVLRATPGRCQVAGGVRDRGGVRVDGAGAHRSMKLLLSPRNFACARSVDSCCTFLWPCSMACDRAFRLRMASRAGRASRASKPCRFSFTGDLLSSAGSRTGTTP